MLKVYNLVILGFLVLNSSRLVASSTAPNLIQGNFKFRGQYLIESQRHFEVINAVSDSEMARMAQLRSQGYDCMAKPMHRYLCEKILEADQHNPLVAGLIAKRYQDYRASFDEALKVSPETVSQDYRQWQVDQKVVINKIINEELISKTFKSMTYVWNGFDKIYPGGDENLDRDTFVVNGNDLEVPWFLQASEHTPGDSSWDSFSISVVLNRVP